MVYIQNPNEGTLWINEFKETRDAPFRKGQLLISRSLLIELCEQQGKGGDFLVDVSAFERETKTGKSIINIKIEKPFKWGESAEPAIAPPPTPKPKYTAEQIARGKLEKFKEMLNACKSLQEVIDLDHALHEPDRWVHFEAVEVIANEAQDLLAEYKEKFIPKEPTDCSDLLSKIDCEIDRLKLPAKAHCLTRWDKSRAKLTVQELEIYLEELRSAEPAPPQDDFF